MAEDQYVVVQRDEKWWIIIDGERRGPFDQRQEAIDGLQRPLGNRRQWSVPDTGGGTPRGSDSR